MHIHNYILFPTFHYKKEKEKRKRWMGCQKQVEEIYFFPLSSFHDDRWDCHKQIQLFQQC